jgi:membrane protein YdbS with pleckstrin-like domain
MTLPNPGPIDPDLTAASVVAAGTGRVTHDISAPREGDPEKVYYEGSPLVRGNIGSLLLFFLLAVLFIAGPVIYRYSQGEWMTWWVNLAMVVIGIILLVAPVIWARTIRYRISNYRIDYERGLLSKTIDTTELWHVDDIRFHQSLIERILGVGTITIFASDQTSASLPLRGLPKPREIFDAVKARVIAIKRSRGVIKMDT